MIYMASKACHGPEWRNLRDQGGFPILSTWINESGVGEISDWPDLWTRRIQEASQAKVLIVVRRDNEVLKGAWAEVGAALAHGVPVFAVGCDEFSIRHHPLVTTRASLNTALNGALKIIGAR
mgnify:CR=1 FL=1